MACALRRYGITDSGCSYIEFSLPENEPLTPPAFHLSFSVWLRDEVSSFLNESTLPGVKILR
ncbi:MAG: hypothetical protein P8X74_00390 [Reinekea sp.]